MKTGAKTGTSSGDEALYEVPCFASGTAIACERPATWRVETKGLTLHVCDQHLRLFEVKCEREGLSPRSVPEWCDPREREQERRVG